jgi:hypothetical protein
VRALDEAVMLLNSMGEDFARTGNTTAAQQCFDQAREAHERSKPVREVLNGYEQLTADELRVAGS